MWDAEDAEAVTVTVENLHVPGSRERRWSEPEPAGAVTSGVRGLPRAPHRPAGARPGSTITSTRETRVSASTRLPAAGRAPAAEHMTDVTLDDVLDDLSDTKSDCFATYDQCAVLAANARMLRDALADLAEDLAVSHNVIGRLFSGAMARLSESMDVLARKSEAMRTRSLGAAESVETAHDAMHDAYRPVQMATADAGLHMPSARIHNED